VWIALTIAIALTLLAWIVAPLFGVRRSWAPRERATAAEQLEAERGKILRALKDLEQERDAGTIGESEYDELRRDYLAEAAAVYRRLDEIGAASGGGERG